MIQAIIDTYEVWEVGVMSACFSFVIVFFLTKISLWIDRRETIYRERVRRLGLK